MISFKVLWHSRSMPLLLAHRSFSQIRPAGLHSVLSASTGNSTCNTRVPSLQCILSFRGRRIGKNPPVELNRTFLSCRSICTFRSKRTLALAWFGPWLRTQRTMALAQQQRATSILTAKWESQRRRAARCTPPVVGTWCGL